MSIDESKKDAARRLRSAGRLVVGLLLVTACGASESRDERLAARSAAIDSAASGGRGSSTESRTILFVGTSITAGFGLEPDSAYPQLIDHRLDSLRLPFDAVNAGVSGETSAALLRRLDWLLREPFDVIVIETGANDGLRGIPVATVRSNIQQIIDRIKRARPQATIVLAQMEALPNLGEKYTSEFRGMFPELAERNNVTLLPFLLDGVAGHRELNQADGIHPNMAGERIVAENVWRSLRPVLESRLETAP